MTDVEKHKKMGINYIIFSFSIKLENLTRTDQKFDSKKILSIFLS